MRELEDSLDSRELTEWMALHDIEPFGDDWRRTGEIAAILHNVHRKEAAEPVTAEAYMPLRNPRTSATRPQTGQEVLTLFRGLAAQTSDDEHNS